MTRIVTVLAATLALTVADAVPAPEAPSLRSISNSIFQIDISPEEAQQYLNSPPFTSPQLSAKTATLPLVRWDDPRFRSAESGPTNGHYWKNGREIENTQDYDEEVYDAQQFHGQDGLGAYAYGYKTPESSKVENRVRSGDVTGSYEFKAGNNDIIKVRYWADSEGFHQEDNLPRDLPKPPEEPEDVRQARLAHEKAWQEAAAAAAQQPDPQGEYNVNSQQQYQQYQQYQPSASEQSHVIAAPSSNQFQREGKTYQNFPGPNETQREPSQESNQVKQQVRQSNQEANSQQAAQIGPLQGQSSEQQPQYAAPQNQPEQRQSRQQIQYGQQNPSQQQAQRQQQSEEPEPTGPPRGFFYSFNYPVSIITRKGGEQDSGPYGRPGQQAQYGNQGRPGGQQPIDSDTIGVNAQRP